jgi:hypothetical protein
MTETPPGQHIILPVLKAPKTTPQVDAPALTTAAAAPVTENTAVAATQVCHKMPQCMLYHSTPAVTAADL